MPKSDFSYFFCGAAKQNCTSSIIFKWFNFYYDIVFIDASDMLDDFASICLRKFDYNECAAVGALVALLCPESCSSLDLWAGCPNFIAFIAADGVCVFRQFREKTTSSVLKNQSRKKYCAQCTSNTKVPAVN